jgi:hypothetical protein
MALEPIDLSSIAQLYDFVESCGMPTGFILDHDAPHWPWARAVSSACFELKWFYPQSALPQVLLTHLSNFAHQSLPDTPILLIRNGQVYRVVDVDKLNGRAESHRLGSYVRQILNLDAKSHSEGPRRSEEPRLKVNLDSADPFSVLGCSPSDSVKTIRKRYKELIRQYHPDRVNDLGPELRELAAEKTKAINVALQAVRKKLRF